MLPLDYLLSLGVCGDFNETLHHTETSNPASIRTSRSMRLFGECLGDLGLFDLPYSGPKFTWTNKRPSDPIGKKIDRCLDTLKVSLSMVFTSRKMKV